MSVQIFQAHITIQPKSSLIYPVYVSICNMFFFLAQFQMNVVLLNSELSTELWILHSILSTQTHQYTENPSEMNPPVSAQNWSFGTTNPYE